MEHASPAVEGGFLTIGQPGKGLGLSDFYFSDSAVFSMLFPSLLFSPWPSQENCLKKEIWRKQLYFFLFKLKKKKEKPFILYLGIAD